mmetsp:Transcript_15433/g.22004  ORF Transcript_15433/g.22004 Transcript_15433/m.22004 type:complete len:93 (+) Transcript_15433:614-892(+)
MVANEGFIMEPKATDSSFLNGVAERPNRTLAVIMRCLLRNAGLGPEYWSWALAHAAYIKTDSRIKQRGKHLTLDGAASDPASSISEYLDARL